jgi:hypothetical protein
VADQAARFRMAATTIDGTRHQGGSGPNPESGTVAPALQSPPEAGPPGAQPTDPNQPAFGGMPPPQQPAWSAPAVSLPTPAELSAIFDVSTNGRAMLSAAGGLALAVLGLRTLFGRRRAAAARVGDDD